MPTADAARIASAQREVLASGAAALVVWSLSAGDPDAATLLGEVHIGECLVIITPARGALSYVTAMERDEAAASGLELLRPEDLALAALGNEVGRDSVEFSVGWLQRALAAAGVPGGCGESQRILLAGHPPAGWVAQAVDTLAGYRFAAGRSLARGLRKRKTASELQEIRRVAAVLVEAFREVATILAESTTRDGLLWRGAEPLRVKFLRERVRALFGAHGLSEPHGNILAQGDESAVPHSQGDSGRQLREGESFIVDLYPKGRLYADCTRTFCVGEPRGDVARAHELVARALRRAHALLPGAKCGWDLQAATCDLFEAKGLATLRLDPNATEGYVHGLGHGVGYELHETPSFRQGAGEAGFLEPGDVLTLEPGLYSPRSGYGVRLEDLIYLDPRGSPENLTPLPHELDPRRW